MVYCCYFTLTYNIILINYIWGSYYTAFEGMKAWYKQV